jgi:hypothetical protein
MRGAAVSLAVLAGAVATAHVWLPPGAVPARVSAATSPILPVARMSMPMDMTMPDGMRMPRGVSRPEHGPILPARIKHGLAHRLQQYPAVYLATPRQRAAAERLRRRLFAAARRFADPRAAEAAGFDLRRARREPGERRVMWFHSENRIWHAGRTAALQPSRPDTLIYADLPGRPLRLVGVMISMPRGVRGPTPGGPITRWHYHLVCVAGAKRGLAPSGDGSCPAGSKLGVGSEMMHVWFTPDLRSAYAIHAPWPELCAEQLLPRAACASGKRVIGM